MVTETEYSTSFHNIPWPSMFFQVLPCSSSVFLQLSSQFYDVPVSSMTCSKTHHRRYHRLDLRPGPSFRTKQNRDRQHGDGRRGALSSSSRYERERHKFTEIGVGVGTRERQLFLLEHQPGGEVAGERLRRLRPSAKQEIQDNVLSSWHYELVHRIATDARRIVTNKYRGATWAYCGYFDWRPGPQLFYPPSATTGASCYILVYTLYPTLSTLWRSEFHRVSRLEVTRQSSYSRISHSWERSQHRPRNPRSWKRW